MRGKPREAGKRSSVNHRGWWCVDSGREHLGTSLLPVVRGHCFCFFLLSYQKSASFQNINHSNSQTSCPEYPISSRPAHVADADARGETPFIPIILIGLLILETKRQSIPQRSSSTRYFDEIDRRSRLNRIQRA
jgi:hypothetical protein